MDGSKRILLDFSEAVREALQEARTATYEQIDRGLDKAMDYMRDKLAAASPIESGLTRASWQGEGKYKGVRYINNTRTTGKRNVKKANAVTANAGEDGVPIVNLLEFGSKGKPFVRATIEREQQRIINIIKEEVEK